LQTVKISAHHILNTLLQTELPTLGESMPASRKGKLQSVSGWRYGISRTLPIVQQQTQSLV